MSRSLTPLEDFDLGQFTMEDGTIDHGKLIRWWRKQVLEWKHAHIAVDLYNEMMEAMHENTISDRWWQRMEQHFHSAPVDEKRRFVIQVLLNIPPSYLGLSVLGPVAPFLEESAPKKGQVLDFQDFQDRIADFWRSSATKQTPIFSDLLTRVSRLEEAVLYGQEEQRSLAASLLGHYLLLAGNAYRYRGHMARAIEYLDKAFVLAHERNDEELLAKVHYVRGFTFFNRWTNQNIDDDRTTLVAALQDFNAAEQKFREAERAGTNRAFSSSLITAILADGGRAAAYNATTRKDCLAAAHKVERAGKIVCSSHFSPDTHFLRIDEGWWHIDKAEAFLAGGWTDLAIEHLEVMEKGDLQARQRYLYREIIQAEAYIAKGWGDIGIMYLERTLDALDQTTIRRHLTHISRLHGKLTQDERYRKMPAVAHLGGKLFQFQHPELFRKEGV